MNPVDRTRPDLPEHGQVITIGGVRVRIRRNWGMERSPTPVLWDVLDGERVAETFLSRPSASDCQGALRRHETAQRAEPPAAIPDPKAEARRRGGEKLKRTWRLRREEENA